LRPNCKLLNQRLPYGDYSVAKELSMYMFLRWRRVHRTFVVSELARPASVVLLLGQAFCFAGCSGAPSVTIAGAYFPAWLLCAVIAVLLAVFVHALFVATRLAEHIPYQLAVCCAAGLIAGLILWHFWVAQ
jgi:hypothetical protein